MTNKMKFNKITAFLLALLLFGMLFVPVFMINASAEDEDFVYSSASEDLQKDPSFIVSDFSYYSKTNFDQINNDNNSDNDLEVVNLIHIGEGKNGQFFIYTYEPLVNEINCPLLTIRFSTGLGSKNYREYDLQLVSDEGYLRKYLVKNYSVSYASERYYNITEIERVFNSVIDGDSYDGNTTITSKAIQVGQTWYCTKIDGELIYQMEKLNIVSIEPVLTGFVHYDDGFRLGDLVNAESAIRSHFIAFSIENYDVEKIYDADIEWKQRKVGYYYQDNLKDPITFIKDLFSGKFETNEIKESFYFPEGEEFKECEKTISNELNGVKYEGKGLFGRTYLWTRIVDYDGFNSMLENNSATLSSAFQDKINSVINADKKVFFFSFAETEFTFWNSVNQSTNGFVTGSTYSSTYYETTDVDVVRIHFLSEGQSYNLGVVSDKTKEDQKADAWAEGLSFDMFEDFKAQMEEFLEKAVIVVGAIALICVLSFISPLMTVVKFIWNIIVHIILLIWSILTLPFKILFRQRE